MKKVLGILFAVCFLASLLTGCTSSSAGPTAAGTAAVEQNTAAAEPTGSAAAAPSESPEATLQPTLDPAFLEQNPAGGVDMSVAIIFGDQVTGAKLDYIQKRFGLNFNLRSLTLADWNTQISTMISANDVPDVVWWDVSATTSNMYRQWSQQGAFRSIPEDYITLRPNMAVKYANNAEVFNNFKIDGQLYYWPCFVDYIPEAKGANTNGVWVYRRDWAKAVGLWKENDTYTFEEWIALAKAVVQQDPGKNGAGKTIGFVTPTWGWPANLLLAYGANPGIFGEGYYKGDDGKYAWAPATEEFKKEVILTQQIYNDGLISKDNAAWKSSEAQSAFGTGMAFALSGCMNGTVSSYQSQLFAAKLISSPDADVCAPAIVTYNGSFYLSEATPYWAGVSFSSKVSDLAMNRFFNMTDFLCSKDGAYFYFWGRPDVDYTLNAEGKVQILWAPDPENPGAYLPPDNFGVNLPFLYMVGGQHQDIQVQQPNLIDKSELTANDKNVLRDYDLMVKVFDHPFILNKQDYQLNFLSTPSKDKLGDFSATVNSKLAELLPISKDIGADWDAFIQSMMPQVQPVLDEINAAIGSK